VLQVCLLFCFLLFIFCWLQALLSTLDKLQESLMDLEVKKSHIVPQMDAAGSANVTSNLTKLRARLDDLQNEASRLQQQIESDLDLAARLDEKYRSLSQFLETTPDAKLLLKSIDAHQLRQNLAQVQDILKKFDEMEPERTDLNRLAERSPVG
jgi:Tfp pilus assembly protein PilO